MGEKIKYDVDLTFEEWMTNRYQAMDTGKLEEVLRDKLNEQESIADSIGRIENELHRRKMLEEGLKKNNKKKA